jgi:hypothetical protein
MLGPHWIQLCIVNIQSKFSENVIYFLVNIKMKQYSLIIEFYLPVTK